MASNDHQADWTVLPAFGVRVNFTAVPFGAERGAAVKDAVAGRGRRRGRDRARRELEPVQVLAVAREVDLQDVCVPAVSVTGTWTVVNFASLPVVGTVDRRLLDAVDREVRRPSRVAGSRPGPAACTCPALRDGRGVGQPLAVPDPADGGRALGRESLDVDVVRAVDAAGVALRRVVIRDPLAAEVVVLGLDPARDGERLVRPVVGVGVGVGVAASANSSQLRFWPSPEKVSLSVCVPAVSVTGTDRS